GPGGGRTARDSGRLGRQVHGAADAGADLTESGRRSLAARRRRYGAGREGESVDRQEPAAHEDPLVRNVDESLELVEEVREVEVGPDEREVDGNRVEAGRGRRRCPFRARRGRRGRRATG